MFVLTFIIVACILALFIGAYFGAEMHTTNISGLRVALVFGSAVVGAIGAGIIGLLGWAIASDSSILGMSVLAGAASAVIGCGVGYFADRPAFPRSRTR